MNPSLHGNTKEERIGRILDAALEVFAEFSFDDATTGEIARRAHVSKRDLYACFPTKQALLVGVVIREMQRHDEAFRRIVERPVADSDLDAKLREIGYAVVAEILSPTMGVVRRLVVSESINQPFLGDLFFEGGIAQRCKLIASVLGAHMNPQPAPPEQAPERAAQRYFSAIAYLPATMTEIGLRHQWSDEAIQAHVAGETDSFLKSYRIGN